MKLIRIVCFEFGVDPDDIFKFKIRGNVALARKVVCYMMHEVLNIPMMNIILITGYPKRDKIVIASRYISDMISVDKELKQKVERIKQVINENKSKKAA